MYQKFRYGRLFKVMAIVLARLLLFSQIAWVYPIDALHPSGVSGISKQKTQQEFLNELRRRSGIQSQKPSLETSLNVEGKEIPVRWYGPSTAVYQQWRTSFEYTSVSKKSNPKGDSASLHYDVGLILSFLQPRIGQQKRIILLNLGSGDAAFNDIEVLGDVDVTTVNIDNDLTSYVRPLPSEYAGSIEANYVNCDLSALPESIDEIKTTHKDGPIQAVTMSAGMIGWLRQYAAPTHGISGKALELIKKILGNAWGVLEGEGSYLIAMEPGCHDYIPLLDVIAENLSEIIVIGDENNLEAAKAVIFCKRPQPLPTDIMLARAQAKEDAERPASGAGTTQAGEQAEEDAQLGAGPTQAGVLPHRGYRQEGTVNDQIIEALKECIPGLIEAGRLTPEDAEGFLAWYATREAGSEPTEEKDKLPIHKLVAEDRGPIIASDGTRGLRVVMLPVDKLGVVNARPFYGHIGLREGIIWVAEGISQERGALDVEVDIMHEEAEYDIAAEEAQRRNWSIARMALWRDGKYEDDEYSGFEEARKFFNIAHLKASQRVIYNCLDEFQRFAEERDADKGYSEGLGIRLNKLIRARRRFKAALPAYLREEPEVPQEFGLASTSTDDEEGFDFQENVEGLPDKRKFPADELAEAAKREAARDENEEEVVDWLSDYGWRAKMLMASGDEESKEAGERMLNEPISLDDLLDDLKAFIAGGERRKPEDVIFRKAAFVEALGGIFSPAHLRDETGRPLAKIVVSSLWIEPRPYRPSRLEAEMDENIYQTLQLVAAHEDLIKPWRKTIVVELLLNRVLPAVSRQHDEQVTQIIYGECLKEPDIRIAAAIVKAVPRPFETLAIETTTIETYQNKAAEGIIEVHRGAFKQGKTEEETDKTINAARGILLDVMQGKVTDEEAMASLIWHLANPTRPEAAALVKLAKEARIVAMAQNSEGPQAPQPAEPEPESYEHPLGDDREVRQEEQSLRSITDRLIGWWLSKDYPLAELLGLYRYAFSHSTVYHRPGSILSKDADTTDPYTGLPQVSFDVPTMYVTYKRCIDSVDSFILHSTYMPREAKGLVVLSVIRDEITERLIRLNDLLNDQALLLFESRISSIMQEFKKSRVEAVIYLTQNLRTYPELVDFLTRNREPITEFAVYTMAEEFVEGLEQARACRWLVENGLIDPDPEKIELAFPPEKEFLSCGDDEVRILATELQQLASASLARWANVELARFKYMNVDKIRTFFMLLQMLSYDGEKGFKAEGNMETILVKRDAPPVDEFMAPATSIIEPVRKKARELEERIARLPIPQPYKDTGVLMTLPRQELLKRINERARKTPGESELRPEQLNEILDGVFPKVFGMDMYLQAGDVFQFTVALTADKYSFVTKAQTQMLMAQKRTERIALGRGGGSIADGKGGETKDEGFILKGRRAARKLARAIRAGEVRPFKSAHLDAVDFNGLSQAIASKLSDTVGEYALSALQDLKTKNKVEFDSVILGSRYIPGQEDQFALGFCIPNSTATAEQGPLQNLYGENERTLGYATDLLEYLKQIDEKLKDTHLVAEYLLHEALETYFDHQSCRNIQNIIFPENYITPNVNDEGILRDYLRAFVNGRFRDVTSTYEFSTSLVLHHRPSNILREVADRIREEWGISIELELQFTEPERTLFWFIEGPGASAMLKPLAQLNVIKEEGVSSEDPYFRLSYGTGDAQVPMRLILRGGDSALRDALARPLSALLRNRLNALGGERLDMDFWVWQHKGDFYLPTYDGVFQAIRQAVEQTNQLAKGEEGRKGLVASAAKGAGASIDEQERARISKILQGCQQELKYFIDNPKLWEQGVSFTAPEASLLTDPRNEIFEEGESYVVEGSSIIFNERNLAGLQESSIREVYWQACAQWYEQELIRHFDRLAEEGLSFQRPEAFEGRVGRIKDWLKPADVFGKTVLDAGTGTGAVAYAAADEGAGRVFAVDISGASLQNAMRNNEKHATKMTFIQQSLLSLEGVEAADVVVAHNVLSYFPPALRRKALEQMVERCKEGGDIIIRETKELVFEDWSGEICKEYLEAEGCEQVVFNPEDTKDGFIVRGRKPSLQADSAEAGEGQISFGDKGSFSTVKRQQWAESLVDELENLPPDKRLCLILDTSIGNLHKYGDDLIRELESIAQREGLKGRLDIITGEYPAALAASAYQYLKDNPNAIVRGVIGKDNRSFYQRRFTRQLKYRDRIRLVAVEDGQVPNTDPSNLRYIPILPIIESSLSGTSDLRPIPYTTVEEGQEDSIITSIRTLLPTAEPISIEEELMDYFKQDAVFVENA